MSSTIGIAKPASFAPIRHLDRDDDPLARRRGDLRM